jgi:hypothetical protein
MRPEAAAVTTGKYPAVGPASPALSGLYLKLGVLLGESYFGPSIFNFVASRAFPGLLPVSNLPAARRRAFATRSATCSCNLMIIADLAC